MTSEEKGANSNQDISSGVGITALGFWHAKEQHEKEIMALKVT